MSKFSPNEVEPRLCAFHISVENRLKDMLRHIKFPRFDLKHMVIHLLLIIAVLLIGFPIYYSFVLSTQNMQEVISRPPILHFSKHLADNFIEAWIRTNMGRLLLNTLIVSLAVTVGKITISVLSAFAIVFFRFPLKGVVFWMIFVTLMLPVPIRIVSTYQVISQIGLLNTYAGLIIPLMASATATFLFRQFYLTVPRDLPEATQLDGAGPLRFLWHVLIPLSLPNIAALFVVLFIYAWNQYLWPLMITHTPEMRVVVIGIESLVPRSGTHLPEWNITMAAAIMALLPPVMVIMGLQKWFIKGLITLDK